MCAILIWTLLDRSIDVMIAQEGGEGEYVPFKLYIFLCKPSSMGPENAAEANRKSRRAFFKKGIL
jgi:hypothetical protein